MAKQSIIEIILKIVADKAITVLKTVRQRLDDLNGTKSGGESTKELDGIADGAKNAAEKTMTLGERFTALKNRIQALAGGGFALGAIFKLVKDFVALQANNFLEGLKDKSDQISMTRSQLEQLNATREKQRQADSLAMSQLAELAAAQQLTTVQMDAAKEIVSDLSRRYGDLGLSLDTATGKLNGYAAATVQLAEKQKAARIAETKKDIANLRDNIASNRDVIANDTGWQSIKTQGKSTEYANNAARENLDLNSKLAEKMQQLNELNNQDPGKARQIAAANLMQTTKEQLEIDLLEAQGLAEQAKRRRLLLEYQSQGKPLTQDELNNLVEMQITYDKMIAAAKERKNWHGVGVISDADKQAAKDAIADIEYEINLQKLKNAGFDDEARRLQIVNNLRKSKQNWSPEMVDNYASKQNDLSVVKLDEIIAKERLQAQLQALRKAGLDDEADRLQTINDLKSQGVDYTKEDAKFTELLAIRKAAREGKAPDPKEDKPQLDNYAQLGLVNWGLGPNLTNHLDQDRNKILKQIADNTKALKIEINEV